MFTSGLWLLELSPVELDLDSLETCPEVFERPISLKH